MGTTWNATQQTVTDHRNTLESAARERRLVKRPRRNRWQRRRTPRTAFGRTSEPSPVMYRPHPAI